MNKSNEIKNLANALLTFHKEMGVIKKEDTNPFFKSKYASLSTILTAIKEPLQKAGLSFTQFPDGEFGLTTILIHGESGEWMESTFSMKPAKQDPQGHGSALTYARRYALSAALGLNIDDDDDGNAASNPTEVLDYKPDPIYDWGDPTQSAPQTAPIDPKAAQLCEQCGQVAKVKEGLSKTTGKPWRGVFCTADRTHVKWIKD